MDKESKIDFLNKNNEGLYMEWNNKTQHFFKMPFKCTVKLQKQLGEPFYTYDGHSTKSQLDACDKAAQLAYEALYSKGTQKKE